MTKNIFLDVTELVEKTAGGRGYLSLGGAERLRDQEPGKAYLKMLQPPSADRYIAICLSIWAGIRDYKGKIRVGLL
ncbi:MAG: hypothetical protein V4539_02365 [Bacteroidota bacterium]